MKNSVKGALAAAAATFALNAGATNNTPTPAPTGPVVTNTVTNQNTIKTEGSKGGDVKIGDGALSPTSRSGSRSTSDANASLVDNSQQTIDASNHTQFKAGAATNVPSAAGIFALKNCVSSISIGLGGGNVYAGYGGLSFSFTGSGALAISFDENGKKKTITTNELAMMNAEDRAKALTSLSADDQEKAMCIASQFQGEMIRETARLEAEYKVAIARNRTDEYLAELRAKVAVELEAMRQAGMIVHTAMLHECALAVVPGQPITVPRGDTNKARSTDKHADGSLKEHAKCTNRADEAMSIISGRSGIVARRPVYVEPTESVFSVRQHFITPANAPSAPAVPAAAAPVAAPAAAASAPEPGK